MRTLFIAPALFSSEGGIERMMRLYIKALCESGRKNDEVMLASLNDSELPADRLEPYANERLVARVAGSRRHPTFVLRCLLLALTADRIITGHFHLMRIAHLARRLRPKLQIFVVVHGTEVWRPWTRREQRLALTGIRFLAVSDYTKHQILGNCPGLLDTKVIVVPNTLDPMLAVAPKQPVERDPNLMLTVCRLSASDSYKGVDHIIEALPSIRMLHPEAHLRIVGRGNDGPRLATLASKLAPGVVKFAGFIPDDEMPAEYAKAGLFVLPSRDEGFGLVYLEAFRQGTPCVASSSGAAPELITPKTGRCVAYGDVSLLGTTCCEALSTTWNQAEIVKRAEAFDFTVFKKRLAHSLDSRPSSRL